MTWSGPFPAERLPTLTEVVDLVQTRRPPVRDEPVSTPVATLACATLTVDAPVSSDGSAAGAVTIPGAITEEQVIKRVLTDLQLQIDLMLESRLREVLAPLLERATERLVRDARNELASTLHVAVALAVTRELERHRVR